ncbi:MAG: hypothetical protein ACI30K_01080 [Muribaculaceae bacterium]
MKRLSSIIIAAIAALCGGATSAETLSFVNLPYAEGTLYVMVTAADRSLAMQRIPITSGVIDINADFSSVPDSTLVNVMAFQDLNDNYNLDLDNYGRPTEPCINTQISLSSPRTDKYTFELTQY